VGKELSMVKRTPVRDERGQILILTALSMTVLLGMAVLSIDASFMYDKRNRLSAAADAAAKSAAAEYLGGNTSTPNLLVFAKKATESFALDPGGTTNVQLWSPPATGPFVGHAGYVEVQVSEVTSTFFGRVIGWASLTPTARAVAGASKSANCLVVLGSSADALSVGNNTTLSLMGCDVADGGGLDLKPNAEIDADLVSVTDGPCYGVANCFPNSPAPSDPLLNLPPPSPAPPYSCTMPVSVSADVTITTANVNAYYCGMEINNAIVTFDPGVYYIAGPITALNGGSNVTINGTGVMFYLAPGGSFNLGVSNFVTLNLSAPTTGTYRGILFYQARGNTAPASLSKNGNAGSLTLSGAMYFPDASLEMKNNNGLTNDCALIVVKSLDINNNTGLSNACTGYGGSPIQTVSVAE